MIIEKKYIDSDDEGVNGDDEELDMSLIQQGMCCDHSATIDKQNKAFMSWVYFVKLTSYVLIFPFHREDNSEFCSNDTSYKISAL